MTTPTAVDALKERIKELSCLYDISTIASDHTDSLEEILHAIAARIAKAWKYTDDAVAEIKINEKLYLSNSVPADSVHMASEIIIDKEQVGIVRIHYPAARHPKSDFLAEEAQLLKKIAQEIAAISERHQRLEQEEKLKRTAERNDRLSILGEITAGIAHELNTPLGNILGFAELISEKTRESQVKRDAEKITDSAIYAREIVKKLMFFSCEMPQRRELIAVNALVEDALKLLNPMLKSAAVNVQFNADPENSFAQLDPIQITQVIFNLLINAIYASPANSTIKVSLKSGDKKLSITIEDEGSGIPEEVRDKIFEPFFTTKPLGEGSGLGLSVVHGIIKSHKGRIQFSTEEGKGTTFNIILPIHP
ncbi:MAG: GHKL domain-containing protein [Cyclobacteriaceae bacterium]|nr:GHKL domain-containing protein [Cyclobacteriaceae bacterium]